MPLVVHYWAELQSMHGLRCYGNITRTRNVREYMLVLALCLVSYCSHYNALAYMLDPTYLLTIQFDQWRHQLWCERGTKLQETFLSHIKPGIEQVQSTR